jgi:hypothetical protein
VERFENIFGLPYPGYKHPRERHSAEEKAALQEFVNRLAEKHGVDPYRRLHQIHTRGAARPTHSGGSGNLAAAR